MLQTQTVSAELLDLLNALMQISELEQLRLVGGTALALQIGHRSSVDIDLFGSITADDFRLSHLLSRFQSVKSLGGSTSIKVYLINGIKVDFVNYPYPWIEPEIIENGIRLAGKKDIAAMKIAAITQRGSKKDFIDLYFLLQFFSLKEIFTFYQEKIKDANIWLALRSLTYFDDADKLPMPKMFNEISWERVKKQVYFVVKEYLEDVEGSEN